MGLFVQGNEFVVGSRPCPERSVSPGTLVLTLSKLFSVFPKSVIPLENKINNLFCVIIPQKLYILIEKFVKLLICRKK